MSGWAWESSCSFSTRRRQHHHDESGTTTTVERREEERACWERDNYKDDARMIVARSQLHRCRALTFSHLHGIINSGMLVDAARPGTPPAPATGQRASRIIGRRIIGRPIIAPTILASKYWLDDRTSHKVEGLVVMIR